MQLHLRTHNLHMTDDEREVVLEMFLRALDRFERQIDDVVIRVDQSHPDRCVCRASIPVFRDRPIVVEETDRRMMSAVCGAAERVSQVLEQRLHAQLHAERVDGRARVRAVKERAIRGS